MKHTFSRIASALAILLVLASCSTLQRMSDEQGAAWVAQQLNEGNAAELAAISSSPFLLDGEIIALPEDAVTFWEGLVKAGLKLDPELSRALPVAGRHLARVRIEPGSSGVLQEVRRGRRAPVRASDRERAARARPLPLVMGLAEALRLQGAVLA